MKKASKRKIHVDGEEKTSHQQIQPSTKKTCPTSVKKRTSGYTECNRNKKQKEYNNCDETPSFSRKANPIKQNQPYHEP